MADPLERLLDPLADIPRKTRADKLEALRTAAGDFFRRSLCWREEHPMSLLETSTTDRIASGARLWRLPQGDATRSVAAVLDVRPLRRSEWARLTRRDGTPVVAAWSGVSDSLTALCAFVPERGNEASVPEELLGRWGHDISNGARARLTGNPDAASDFQRAIEDARAEEDGVSGLNQHALGG